jgi:hypothetical protein
MNFDTLGFALLADTLYAETSVTVLHVPRGTRVTAPPDAGVGFTYVTLGPDGCWRQRYHESLRIWETPCCLWDLWTLTDGYGEKLPLPHPRNLRLPPPRGWETRTKDPIPGTRIALRNPWVPGGWTFAAMPADYQTTSDKLRTFHTKCTPSP